eukprot:scaffold14996_cov557-Ochromonas_danica.AAC.2
MQFGRRPRLLIVGGEGCGRMDDAAPMQFGRRPRLLSVGGERLESDRGVLQPGGRGHAIPHRIAESDRRAGGGAGGVGFGQLKLLKLTRDAGRGKCAPAQHFICGHVLLIGGDEHLRFIVYHAWSAIFHWRRLVRQSAAFVACLRDILQRIHDQSCPPPFSVWFDCVVSNPRLSPTSVKNVWRTFFSLTFFGRKKRVAAQRLPRRQTYKRAMNQEWIHEWMRGRWRLNAFCFSHWPQSCAAKVAGGR